MPNLTISETGRDRRSGTSKGHRAPLTKTIVLDGRRCRPAACFAAANLGKRPTLLAFLYPASNKERRSGVAPPGRSGDL